MLTRAIHGYVIFSYNSDLHWHVFESKGSTHSSDILRWFIDMYFGKSSRYEKFQTSHNILNISCKMYPNFD